MQLFEVKNDIAKIIYNPAENHLLPSDFLLIQDVNQKLIAQIVNISTTKSTYDNLADVKLVLSIDNEDNLSYYNGYIPSKSCSIVYVGTDEIIELIKGQNKTIFLGNVSNHSECLVTPSIDFVKDKVYIQSDRDDSTKIVIQNIVAGLISANEKVVVLDFDGCYNSITNVKKLKITEDIKLPLDIDALNTIFDYDIIDCPVEDKAVVQSIILELKEYLKTLKNQFLPFNLFKNVIDSEFASNPISGLMLLRNKLWAYAQSSLFAENQAQLNTISPVLDSTNLVIIDASEIQENWYKFVIQTIKNSLNRNCYFVLSLNDAIMDKKAILNLYNNQNIIPVVYTNYGSRYRQLLKSICKNQVLFKPSKLMENDEPYSILLNKINSAEFIIYGETTLYLPLIIELQSYNIPSNNEIQKTDINNQEEISIDLTDEKMDKQAKQNDFVQIDNDVSNEIFSPVSIQNESESLDTEKEIIDDDFSDDDMDFLDEQSIEPLMVEDNNSDVNPIKVENQYDIFTPLEEQNEEKIENESPVKSIDDGASELEELQEIDIDELLEIDEEKKEIENIQTAEKPEDDILNEEFFVNIDESVIENKIDEKQDSNNIENITEDDIQELFEDKQQEEELENTPEDKISEEDDDDIIPIDDVVNDITSKLEKEEETTTESNEENFEVELENDEEDLLPPPIKEDVKSKESPNLTVYPADNNEEPTEKNIPFEIGDRVYHPKHGYGVIEGFANYSNKILFCQIEFEKVGRRILDPRIAGIEKVS